MGESELQIRQAVDDDLPQILELLQSSLGWVPDAQYADFYRWKHHENPFGRSPAWVAVDGDRIVGLRVWLRWRFVQAGRRWEAVRVVDTATHPDYQGRGIFKRLTTSSLEVLRGAIDHRAGVAAWTQTWAGGDRPSVVTGVVRIGDDGAHLSPDRWWDTRRA